MSDWSIAQSANIVQLDIFGRRGTAPGMSPWHRDAIPPLERAIAKALTTRYGKALERSGIIWTYAVRDIRGGSVHTEHSHPIAVDVNPPTNPLSDDGVMRCDFTRFGMADGIAFVNAFLSEDFRWGATWTTSRSDAERALRMVGKRIRNGRVDAMHFEYEGPPVRYERRVRYLVRWIGRRGPQKRVFLTLRRARHFIRKLNREREQVERARWLKIVDQEVVRS